MRLKIKSRVSNIRGDVLITNADTGEMLEGVQRVEITLDVHDNPSVALYMVGCDLDLSDLEVTETHEDS